MRKNNSISNTFHYSLPSRLFFCIYYSSTLNSPQSTPILPFVILAFLSPPLTSPLSLPPLRTCTASGDGCRARASVISRGVRRRRVAQSSTGHSMMMGEKRSRNDWCRKTENTLAANTLMQIQSDGESISDRKKV